jgi:hypothetical protein
MGPDLANATYAEISCGAGREGARHGSILLVVTLSLLEWLRLLQGEVDGLLYAIATGQTTDRALSGRCRASGRLAGSHGRRPDGDWAASRSRRGCSSIRLIVARN